MPKLDVYISDSQAQVADQCGAIHGTVNRYQDPCGQKRATKQISQRTYCRQTVQSTVFMCSGAGNLKLYHIITFWHLDLLLYPDVGGLQCVAPSYGKPKK